MRLPRSRVPFSVLAASIALTIASMLYLAQLPFERELVVEAPAYRAEGGKVSTRVDDVDALFTDPFDWDAFRLDDKERYHYIVGNSLVSRAGIDVSEHQGLIDWERVAADGVEFAIIRVGYRASSNGVIMQDPTFSYNLQEARAAGIDVGVYFYSLATSAEEAREEADFTIAELDGAPLEYPIVFDLEPSDESSGRLDGLDKDRMTEIAQAFCEQVEMAGYHSCVYGNQTDLSRYHLMRLAQFGFWYAQYDARPSMVLRFALWQYTQRGEVDGIGHPVDLDLDLTSVFNEEL